MEAFSEKVLTKNRVMAVTVIMLIVSITGWHYRYHIQYNYYLFKTKHYDYIFPMYENSLYDIERAVEVSGNIVPYIRDQYENTNTPD